MPIDPQNPEVPLEPGSGSPGQTPPVDPPVIPPVSDTANLSKEDLLRLLEKEKTERSAANREAQTLRKRANDLEAEQKKRAEAEMSEVDRMKARSQELETQLAESNQKALDTRIMLAASAAGFHDPKDAVALIPRADIDATESNLEALLKDVLKSKPYLAKPSGHLPNKPAGNNPGGAVEEAGSKEQQSRLTSMFPTLKRLGLKN